MAVAACQGQVFGEIVEKALRSVAAQYVIVVHVCSHYKSSEPRERPALILSFFVPRRSGSLVNIIRLNRNIEFSQSIP